MMARLIAGVLVLATQMLTIPADAADLPVCVETRSARAGDETVAALRDAVAEVFPGFDLRAVTDGCPPRVELMLWYAGERLIVDVRLDGRNRSLSPGVDFDVVDLAVDVARLVDRTVRRERLPRQRLAWRQRLRTVDAHVAPRRTEVVFSAGFAAGVADGGSSAAGGVQLPVAWPSIAVGARLAARRPVSLQADLQLALRGWQQFGAILEPRTLHQRYASLDLSVLARIRLRAASPRDRHIVVGPAIGRALWSTTSERVFAVPAGASDVGTTDALGPWLAGLSLGVQLELRPRSTRRGELRRRELEVRATTVGGSGASAGWGAELSARWRPGAARARQTR